MNGQPSPGGSFDVHKHEEVLTSAPPLLGDSLKYKRRMLTGKHYLQRRKAKRSTRILLAGTYTKLWRGLLGLCSCSLRRISFQSALRNVTPLSSMTQHDAA